MPNYDRLRKSAERQLLEETAQIYNRVTTKGPLNEEIIDWQPDGEDYPCRVLMQDDFTGGREGDFGNDIIQGKTLYIIDLPWNSPATRLDQIHVGDTIYEVNSTNAHHTNRLLLNCYCTVKE